jgi:hypothetical protein
MLSAFLPSWTPWLRGPLAPRYSAFLRALSTALHAKGLKMSECVGSYPTKDGGVAVYYDPAVVAETNDVVRVMNCARDRLRPLRDDVISRAVRSEHSMWRRVMNCESNRHHHHHRLSYSSE